MSNRPRNEDLTGQKFGRLTAVKKAAIRKSKGGTRIYWVCKCECGRLKEVSSYALRAGKTESCWCKRRESTFDNRLTHGFSRSGNVHPVFNIWSGMLKRCRLKSCKQYHRYGGRGISVCERWKKFENFRDDMLPTWRKGLSLNRINNDGNYEPENCEWTTPRRQSENMCSNVNYTIDGKTQCFKAWCRELGVKYAWAYQRVYRGHSVESVLGRSIE